jgi:hypothetical protein
MTSLFIVLLLLCWIATFFDCNFSIEGVWIYLYHKEAAFQHQTPSYTPQKCNLVSVNNDPNDLITQLRRNAASPPSRMCQMSPFVAVDEGTFLDSFALIKYLRKCKQHGQFVKTTGLILVCLITIDAFLPSLTSDKNEKQENSRSYCIQTHTVELISPVVCRVIITH